MLRVGWIKAEEDAISVRAQHLTFLNMLAVHWLIWDRVFMFYKSASDFFFCVWHPYSWCEPVSTPCAAVAQLAVWYPDPPCLDLRSGKQGDQSELHVSSTSLAAMTDLDEAAMQACYVLCLPIAHCLFLLVIFKRRLRWIFFLFVVLGS